MRKITNTPEEKKVSPKRGVGEEKRRRKASPGKTV